MENKKVNLTSIDKPYRNLIPNYTYNADYCKKTAYDMVLESPAFNIDSPALNYYGKIIKNSQLISNIETASRAFKNMGVKKDDIVFMFCLNTPEMIYSLYALNKIGAITEWFNPTAISKDLLHKHLMDNKIKTVITIDVMYPILKEAIKDTNVENVIVNSVKDSFDLSHDLMYNAQVFGLNIINQNKYFKSNLETIKSLIPSSRDEGKNTTEQIKQLTKIQKLILDIANYSDKEKIKAKASYYVDENKDQRFISWNDFIKKYYSNMSNVFSKYEDEKPSFIVHTGGTTGPVKRVAMSDYNVNSAIYQSTLTPINMDYNDTFCQLIPPIVAWGLEGLHTARYYNMMSHLICTYDRNEFVDIVLKTKANHYFTVPSFVKTLIDNPKLEGKDLSFIKTINHGGEAFLKEDDIAVDEVLKSHNCNIRNQFGFGQNEEFGCFTINIDIKNQNKDFSCCGIPLPENDIIIIDTDTKEELPYGKNENGKYNIGELLVSGPTTMIGYIGEDEYLNKQTIQYINGKKYIDTGDQAYIDENGKLWYYTRNKRIIRTQDGKIFANVIEEIIKNIEEVDECCVVASPHPQKVKEASCHIVLKKQYKNLSNVEFNLLIEEIINKIENETKRMYSYYIPGTYEFRFEKLPITPVGKIDFIKLEKSNYEEYENNGNKALRKVRYK
jgi:long-chain acyl-CoA synthetase